MKIHGKLPEGYVVLCNNRHDDHCFLVKNLSVSVECPRCGWTALSEVLLTEYCIKLGRGKLSRAIFGFNVGFESD